MLVTSAVTLLDPDDPQHMGSLKAPPVPNARQGYGMPRLSSILLNETVQGGVTRLWVRDVQQLQV